MDVGTGLTQGENIISQISNCHHKELVEKSHPLSNGQQSVLKIPEFLPVAMNLKVGVPQDRPPDNYQSSIDKVKIKTECGIENSRDTVSSHTPQVETHHRQDSGAKVTGCENGYTLPVESSHDYHLVKQLQAKLLDALRKKDDAFLKIKKLKEELKASEKTVKRLTRKLKSLGQTVATPPSAKTRRHSGRKNKRSLKGLSKAKEEDVYVQVDVSPEDDASCTPVHLDQDSVDDDNMELEETDPNPEVVIKNTGDKIDSNDGVGEGGVLKKRKMLPRGENGEKIRPKCPVCDRVCWNYSKLDQHMRLHTGEKPYQCTMCDKTFRLKFQLVQHIRGHNHEKPYTCFICGKGFGVSSVLWVHMRAHTGEKSFQCSLCPKAFSQSAHLTQHMRTHTGQKPFECSLCSKAFKQKAHLILHERMHSGEKPFQCFTCGRTFTGSSHLNRHMKIHTGEKPHKCFVCDMAFSDATYLTRHMTTHTGEKPHTCSICQKAFRVKYNLTQHMRTHSRSGKIKHKAVAQ